MSTFEDIFGVGPRSPFADLLQPPAMRSGVCAQEGGNFHVLCKNTATDGGPCGCGCHTRKAPR